jgi:hypothetical protein
MRVRITIDVDQSNPDGIHDELTLAFEALQRDWEHLVDGVVCGVEGELAQEDDRFSSKPPRYPIRLRGGEG